MLLQEQSYLVLHCLPRPSLLFAITWATTWQNQQNDLFTQGRPVRSTVIQGPKLSSCGHRRTLIRLGTDLSLCWAHRWFCWFCHVVAHVFFSWQVHTHLSISCLFSTQVLIVLFLPNESSLNRITSVFQMFWDGTVSSSRSFHILDSNLCHSYVETKVLYILSL